MNRFVFYVIILFSLPNFADNIFFVEATLPVLVFDILLQVLFYRKCLLFHD